LNFGFNLINNLIFINQWNWPKYFSTAREEV